VRQELNNWLTTVGIDRGSPDFLESEVLSVIAAKYQVETGPQHTAIWAASYGGVAALHTLIHRPDLFGSVIIESPALEVGNGQLLRDTEFLVRTPSRIAVGAGTAEDVDRFGSNAAYIRMVQQLVQNLKAA
jgi:predicted alpha/beta superfamily hydrolase